MRKIVSLKRISYRDCIQERGDGAKTNIFWTMARHTLRVRKFLVIHRIHRYSTGLGLIKVSMSINFPKLILIYLFSLLIITRPLILPGFFKKENFPKLFQRFFPGFIPHKWNPLIFNVTAFWWLFLVYQSCCFWVHADLTVDLYMAVNHQKTTPKLNWGNINRIFNRNSVIGTLLIP